MLLTSDELRLFKRYGYLIKRGVMDPGLMARARECLWDDPPPSLKRDNPRTWVGPLPAGDLSNDPDSIRGHFHWKYRRVGAEPWIVRMLATDPAIFAMAEQMLGAGELQPPERIRGIYSILPFGDRPRPPVGCHCDGHPFHLGVVGYIDDVAAGGGGFCVWPGSHRAFYHTFRTGYLRDTTEGQDAVMERVNRAPPVDCHGEAGDVVFWHHRLASTTWPDTTTPRAFVRRCCSTTASATSNRSRTSPPPPTCGSTGPRRYAQSNCSGSLTEIMALNKLPSIHPGEILAEEFLSPMNITQYRLAKTIGVDPRRIHAIVHGQRAITAETALLFSRFFGNSAAFWMGLQNQHDLETEEDRLSGRLDQVTPYAAGAGAPRRG